MNYMEIRPLDTTNGIGCRVSLFVSGCNVHCPGCFNKESWDFNAGKLFTKETKKEILTYLDNPHIAGLSILGGDPISNILNGDTELIDLVQSIKSNYPDKTIFVWTGHKWEDIINNNNVKAFLYCTNMLRDSPFIEDKKDMMQYLQGSSNQRSIDVQLSLKTGEIQLYNFKNS